MTLEIRFTDSEGFADNTEKALVVLQISRESIESGQYASALERLMVMTDSEANVRLYKGALVFEVSGYEQDPRELSEIQEVRAYFAELNRQWPYWIWFGMCDLGFFPLLFSILADSMVIRDEKDMPGQVAIQFKELNALQTLVGDMVARSMPLFRLHNIRSEEVSQTISSVVDELIS